MVTAEESVVVALQLASVVVVLHTAPEEGKMNHGGR